MPLSAILKKNTIFLRCEIYSSHLKSPLGVKYLQKKYLVFVNSEISVIFRSHLGNGVHIEKLHDGSITYSIQ